MSISVLIITRDEEASLGDCLASVAWCDDILVLDSFSTDGTVAVARSAGARVMQRTFVNFADQRNAGLSEGALRHPWVLHLDADERVTPALHAEMTAAISRTDVDAFFLASRMMFMDRWLKHAATYPAYQARLGRRDGLRFQQVGHGQRETLPGNRMGTLKEPLIHYPFAKGMDEWFARHRRYAADEAREEQAAQAAGGWDAAGLFDGRDPVRRRRSLKALAGRLPARPLCRFLYTYLWRGGWLDGVPGWRYCRLMAMYERMIQVARRQNRCDTHGGSI